MSDTDLDLLKRYSRDHADDAFTELVRRHVDLVFSAALRQVRSPQLAEEVAQSAFTDLARNADKLKPDTIVTAWLYQVTRRTAIDVVRRESRPQLREQIATEMNAMNATDADWAHIEPLLDEAISALDDTDRAAVLLRYFENKSLRDVGATLGTSDDAAQKRVSRAVERLREFFAKRGVTVGASGLAVVIAANAVQAAPAGLAVTISAAATLAGATIATSAALATTKAIAMTTLQKTLITAALTAAVGTGIYEARQTARLGHQIETIQQQQAPLTAQIEQLQRAHDDATNRLALLAEENATLKKNSAELLRLRGEISYLRQNQTTTLKAAMLSSSQTITGSEESSPENIGRELGEAIVRGDRTAPEKLLALAKSEYASFNTNAIGLSDAQRGELGTRTFAPLHAAFDVITREAVTANPMALNALSEMSQVRELTGIVIQSLGTVAGSGNGAALEILLDPLKFGLPVSSISSSVGALVPAANNGNQQAIEALAAVAKNPEQRGLWFMAADGLKKAAESGNAIAVDALIGLLGSTNQNVLNAAVSGLRNAAVNQNTKAADALRSIGVQ